MTRATVVDTSVSDSKAAGSALGVRILEDMPGERPDAVILFASPRYAFPPLLQALDAACQPRNLVGSSSAGEFTTSVQGEGMACAMALRAPEMEFRAAVGRNLSGDREGAARQIVSSFAGLNRHDFAYRSVLVMADALAGQTEQLVEHLNVLLGGLYRFVGGGAGGGLDAVRAELGEAQFAGCNSIGQIARAEGQLSGFHNCTAVVCVIPE